MKRRNGLPPYCTIAKDRHGKRRIRFRAKGFDTYLPFPPTGPDFENAYQAALGGVKEWRANIGASRTKPGTLNALAVAYYRSPGFTGQRAVTQATYRRIIEKFRLEYGSGLIADLRRDHLKSIIGSMADRPAAANRLLILIRIMLELALDNGWIAANPARGVKGFSKKTEGFHSWTDAEISAFEQRHSKGTTARLALTLLLYTAQRRGDVVRMGWTHIKGKRFDIVQSKTGMPLELFMLPAVNDAIRELPRDKPTFLTTDYGKPFTPAGFGNWFRDRCNEAGLPQCSAHGLRKAAARRMAEAGMSADTIKSVTGHTNLRTVSIYTSAANQAELADKGIQAIAGTEKEQILSNLPKKVRQKGG
jgi:integrase